ncbi:MAG: serpin family protein [Lachnospiraceae bacterium]|nr:serpin family protein [Lachnospiraceae bacterium]
MRKRTRKIRRILALLCAAVMILSCTACGDSGRNGSGAATPAAGRSETKTPTPTAASGPVSGEKKSGGSTQMTGTSGTTPEGKPMDANMKKAYENFSYNLFRKLEGGTKMVSPFSLYAALGMFSNGAAGNTLAEINAMLGLTDAERNEYLTAWINSLTAEVEDGAKFTNADSVWIREDRAPQVPKDFLRVCADYYKSEVFAAKMNQGTVEDVNEWVNLHTKGMIKKLLDKPNPAMAMLLLNAISLEAEWVEPFNTESIHKDADFKHADGTVKKVDMMNGEADHIFLENELVTGFVKSYKGGQFRYIALLPKEGVSMETLVNSLGAGSLDALMETKKSGKVYVSIPRYEEEYTVQLADILKTLGMKDAFDANAADLSRLCSSPTVVDSVLQKTFISVDNKGTRAAAVTAIAVADAAFSEPEPVYTVRLDRPFLYMITDGNNLPIFLGTYE